MSEFVKHVKKFIACQQHRIGFPPRSRVLFPAASPGYYWGGLKGGGGGGIMALWLWGWPEVIATINNQHVIHTFSPPRHPHPPFYGPRLSLIGISIANLSFWIFPLFHCRSGVCTHWTHGSKLNPVVIWTYNCTPSVGLLVIASSAYTLTSKCVPIEEEIRISCPTGLSWS